MIRKSQVSGFFIRSKLFAAIASYSSLLQRNDFQYFLKLSFAADRISCLFMEEKRKYLSQLRWIGITEGWSFLLLLGIAMPLKYILDFPIAVKYIGWAHGILFILYIIAVFRAAFALNWKLQRISISLAASVLPFATFILDKRLKQEEELLGKEYKTVPQNI